MKTKLLNAYFAGLIDGEGTIAIYFDSDGKVWRPVIKVNMTCEKTVRAIHSHFGGSFCNKKVEAKCKPQWHWFVSYRAALRVSEKIIPYLITKKDNADKIIEHYASRPLKNRIPKARIRAFSLMRAD